MTTVTFDLPTDLVEQAKANGVLTDARVAALLEAEVKRVEQWREFQSMLSKLRSEAKAEFGNLTDDEIAEMIDGEVSAVRAERRHREHKRETE